MLQPGEHGSVLGDVGDPAVLYVLAQVCVDWLSSLCILNFFFSGFCSGSGLAIGRIILLQKEG